MLVFGFLMKIVILGYTFEAGPSDRTGTHRTRFCVRVERKFTPSSKNLRCCHVLGSEDSCTGIDC